MRTHMTLAFGALALAACNDSAQQPANQPTIEVRGAEQDQLHQLDAMNLAIGL